MLKTISIQNFKGWKETGQIGLAPITLFFGTNSSGKSSIAQFLMMLKQTVESADRKVVFFPGDDKSAVDLGSYQEMVHGRDPKLEIAFSYQWGLDSRMIIRDPMSQTEYSGNTLEFAGTVTQGDAKSLSAALKQFSYCLSEPSDPNSPTLSVGLQRNAKSEEYQVQSEGYPLKRNQGRPGVLKASKRFYGFPDEMLAYHQNAEFVKDLELAHEQMFKSIQYLGPMRSKGARIYAWSGDTPGSVGASGEHTIPAILSAKDRKISLLKSGPLKAEKAISFEALIASQLQKMGLITAFEVLNIESQLHRVKVRTHPGSAPVDLPDVGFGVSQVLPVLVQCYFAQPGSIIIMEQPEIHLHPSAQAALADVMIDVIRSKENGKPRNIQLIIETHSEHFLRRLQRRIAEDILQQGDLAAYFADSSQSPARLDPLQFDLFGNIKNWPKDFFGDSMGDILKHTQAAMLKRASGNAKRNG